MKERLNASQREIEIQMDNQDIETRMKRQISKGYEEVSEELRILLLEKDDEIAEQKQQVTANIPKVLQPLALCCVAGSERGLSIEFRVERAYKRPQ
jgi:hypothetical protein